ncbi:phosphatase PAP2 family protein [Hymenobacter jejuensis]|uniref:phosphatase PAP2 family protein n=1 Tax=Hymenobacter jejuensis TaxID=2502781 RepID=UPI0013FCF472|nr:phosphatase PAP2 family protein [Hymenobacter jejuensis]
MLAFFMWWLWFRPQPDVARTRNVIVALLVGCLLSMAVTKVLIRVFPGRPRPMDNTEMHLVTPYTVDRKTTSNDASSFPSDHATMFFALVAGFWAISRRYGLLALLYVLVVVCLPRLFMSLHYPSDMLAGGIVGIGVTSLVVWLTLHKHLLDPLLRWGQRYPGPFYAGIFLLTYQLGETFDGIKSILSYVLHGN